MTTTISNSAEASDAMHAQHLQDTAKVKAMVVGIFSERGSADVSGVKQEMQASANLVTGSTDVSGGDATSGSQFDQWDSQSQTSGCWGESKNGDCDTGCDHCL